MAGQYISKSDIEVHVTFVRPKFTGYKVITSSLLPLQKDLKTFIVIGATIVLALNATLLKIVGRALHLMRLTSLDIVGV